MQEAEPCKMTHGSLFPIISVQTQSSINPTYGIYYLQNHIRKFTWF